VWGRGNLLEGQRQGGNRPGSWVKRREDQSREMERRRGDHWSSWGKIRLEDPFLGLSCLEAALKVRYTDH